MCFKIKTLCSLGDVKKNYIWAYCRGTSSHSIMNQSAVLIFCLIFLTLNGTQGVPLSRTTRCTCIKISDGSINPRSLEKLEVIPASQSCPRVEIIATLKKNGEKRCLNPASKKIKILLKAISKERSKTSPWTENITTIMLIKMDQKETTSAITVLHTIYASPNCSWIAVLLKGDQPLSPI